MRLPGDDDLGAAASAALGVAVRVCRTATATPVPALTGGERRQCQALPNKVRRHDWLLGRSALKALLPATVDTAGLSFPHAGLSISHAGDMGVAVAVHARESPDDDWPAAVVGVGVDYEPWRATDFRMARFYLRPHEQFTSLGLLRAWTAKEALYKAVRDNQRCCLLDIRLDHPSASTGTAIGPRGERLRYTVIDTATGPLAVAVCLEDHRVTV